MSTENLPTDGVGLCSLSSVCTAVHSLGEAWLTSRVVRPSTNCIRNPGTNRRQTNRRQTCILEYNCRPICRLATNIFTEEEVDVYVCLPCLLGDCRLLWRGEDGEILINRIISSDVNSCKSHRT